MTPEKLRVAVRAVRLGLADGWAEPDDLSQGMTWSEPGWEWANEVYDRAVNAGQAARRLFCTRRTA